MLARTQRLRLHAQSRPASKAGLPATCRRTAVSRSCTVVVRAQRTAEEYAVALRSSLDENDWTKTFELMTELTVLKVDVPLAAQEVAVVSYARGGQWQRAEALYKQLQARGHVAGGDTTQELVNALAAAGKGVEAAALLAAAAAQAGVDAAALAPAHCVVARALARQGQVEEAYAMLNRMMRAEMRIDSGTFTSVAASCMDHGSTELAEEVLEMRDYL